MKSIENIIFDLGGVIINLDLQRSISAFNQLSEVPFESIYTQAKQSSLFDELDKGKLGAESFFRQLRHELNYQGPEETLLQAWNAMLLDVPEHRLDLLVQVKQNYRSFLLSNTCEPHISAFERQLYLEHGVKNFEDYFDRVYYSCRLGLRKPELAIFKRVLDENGLEADKTVFIDDSIQHVKAAGECGINAYLLPKGMEVAELLKQLSLL
ncbi:MAG TPA: HAD family phosphatase [Bacteroidia bacterium]|nr:HAD family phosphatase [Bacteroidia bacterium]